MVVPATSADSLLTFWECAEYAAEGVVILAAVGECVADFTTWIKPRSRKRVVARLSGIVLIVGLAFEVIATAAANNIGNKQIADLNVEASGAAKGAAQATLAAGKLGVSQSNLYGFVTAQQNAIASQMKDFRGFADSQREETKAVIDGLTRDKTALDGARVDALKAERDSETRLAEMKNALNSERDIRQTMLRFVTARRLTGDQITGIQTKLLGLPVGWIQVGVNPPTAEGDALAAQILRLLQMPNIEADPSNLPIPIGPMVGVNVAYIAGSANGERFAEAFTRAMNEAGIPTKSWSGLYGFTPAQASKISDKKFLDGIVIVVGDRG
jgi:hypothetical protein